MAESTQQSHLVSDIDSVANMATGDGMLSNATEGLSTDNSSSAEHIVSPVGDKLTAQGLSVAGNRIVPPLTNVVETWSSLAIGGASSNLANDASTDSGGAPATGPDSAEEERVRFKRFKLSHRRSYREQEEGLDEEDLLVGTEANCPPSASESTETSAGAPTGLTASAGTEAGQVSIPLP